MAEKQTRPDWTDTCWKDMLIFQRKSMWLADTVERLADWLRLEPGLTAIDVGCGLGYLGYTFWPFFGRNGRYIGVDNTPELLREAGETAADWAEGGRADFIHGDACRLPLPDDSADLVMCQTLMIHLEKPQRALAEMIRVSRPGGLILCIEPDNHNPMMGRLYNSVPTLSIDDHLLCAKVHMICHEGRIKLGNGDDSIGSKIPHMMKTLGAVDIEVRANDRVHYLEPPYEGPLQQAALENIRKLWLDKKRRVVLMTRQKENYRAGGGDPDEYERYLKINNRFLNDLEKQVQAGEYYACSAGAVYMVKGRKPIS